VDGLWATKSEGVGLIDRAISFQDFQPMSSRYLNVTDGRTDRRTDESNLITALCTSASRGKNGFLRRSPQQEQHFNNNRNKMSSDMRMRSVPDLKTAAVYIHLNGDMTLSETATITKSDAALICCK